jgi:anti-anti-sigma regulatory factor
VPSTGLHLLLRAIDRANENGHRLAIVGVGGQPRRLLELTDTEGVLIDDAAALPIIQHFSQAPAEKDTSSAVIGDDIG